MRTLNAGDFDDRSVFEFLLGDYAADQVAPAATATLAERWRKVVKRVRDAAGGRPPVRQRQRHGCVCGDPGCFAMAPLVPAPRSAPSGSSEVAQVRRGGPVRSH